MHISFYIYLFDRMDANLQPQVSCRLIMTIIRQRKKGIGEIKKIKKYSSKNVYFEIVYSTFFVCVYVCVCLYRLYLHIIVYIHICDCQYVCVYDDTCVSW